MLAHTKTHPTEIMLTFQGPKELAEKAREMMRSMGFTGIDDGIPWRSAFPEFADNEPGTILKGARLREGFTQKQLAEKTGIPQRHISEIETGKRTIGRKRAEILADALHVSDYRIFL